MMNKTQKNGKCGLPCEVYSRVVGYYRPVDDWNIGKKEEFIDRKTFDAEKALGERVTAGIPI